jgi:hypothetical protein
MTLNTSGGVPAGPASTGWRGGEWLAPRSKPWPRCAAGTYGAPRPRWARSSAARLSTAASMRGRPPAFVSPPAARAWDRAPVEPSLPNSGAGAGLCRRAAARLRQTSFAELFAWSPRHSRNAAWSIAVTHPLTGADAQERKVVYNQPAICPARSRRSQAI